MTLMQDGYSGGKRLSSIAPLDTDDLSKITTAAATFYPPSGRDRNLLQKFSEELKADGVSVGGLVQEALFDKNGDKVGLDIIEVDTGRRIPINRPTKSQTMHHECSLDASALAESSGAIRRAVEGRVDLIIVEKFGEQEQKGKGFAPEILSAITEGIPTLVMVPESAVDIWNRFSGGLAVTVPYEIGALRAWWGVVQSWSLSDGARRN